MAIDRESIYKRLEAGAKTYACGGFIQTLDSIHRYEIFSELCFDRLKRKCDYIDDVFRRYNCDWLQTIYHMLFRSLDVGQNRQAYELLSDIARFKILQREGFDSITTEALLFGTAGLLTTLNEDNYIKQLKEEFDFLAHKYDLSVVSLKQWNLRRITASKHPLIRLSQMVNFLANKELSMEAICQCSEIKDIEKMFRVSAKQYWCEIANPSTSQFPLPVYIGYDKIDLFGINFVVPLQLSYASYTANDTLSAKAISLLESIRAENNHYTRSWASFGVKVRNAFESQAMIQLASEYCDKKRCSECPVAKVMVANAEKR